MQLSLFSSSVGQSAGPSTAPKAVGQGQRLCWTTRVSDAGIMAQQLWVLTLLLRLARTSAGLWPQRLHFVRGETELNYLVVDEAVQWPLQGHLCPAHPSTKSCLYCSTPLTCESLKFFSCNIARALFLQEQYMQLKKQCCPVWYIQRMNYSALKINELLCHQKS